MFTAVRRRLHLYLSPLKRLSSPMEASKRLRGAMRWGFLSLSPVFGAGMLIRLEENSFAGHTEGNAAKAVALTPLQMRPAWNSSSAVRGAPNASTILMAGWPLSSVEESKHGLL